MVASFAGSLECSRRGVLAAAGANGTETVLSQFENIHIYSAAEDALVGPGIRAGAYEPEVCTHVRRLLRPGMCMLDLGANIGFFSLLAAQLVGPHGRVFAVEPNPANVRLLEASRRRNHFDHLQVFQIAAAAKPELLVLNTSYSNGTTAPLPEEASAVLQAITVPAFPMDMILPPGQRIDLIKVDVEGAEYKALSGCENLLRQHRPVILSEFSPSLMPGISGITGAGYLAWLIGMGYAMSVISPDGTLLPFRNDPDAVMRAHAQRKTDHVDLLLQPLAPAAS